MFNRGRLLVSLIQDSTTSENSNNCTIQESSAMSEVQSLQAPFTISNNINDKKNITMPSPSISQLHEQNENDYYVSPSEESVIDDSDTDPNFILPRKLPPKIISSSSTSSSTSNSSSSSSGTSSSSSSSDAEDEISDIPRIESHYLRAQTSREFICSDKTLADLYRDYKDVRESKQLPIASVSTFNRIFNTQFNISFFVPKKDLCDLCESHKNADEEGKRQLREKYEQHLMEKNLARVEKENDKNRKDGVIVAVFDLQAVMQVPKGQVSLFFYKSRINCFNFTVSDLKAKDVICYFWDESEGKRGAIEIGSCILNYIDTLLDSNPNKNIDIIFYSDNCCGQQKNKFLLSAYAYAVVNKRVNSITHKFLIRGHSQNEGDNVHSVIEKQIKRHIKSGPIYVPQQYSTLIRTAKKTGCPYKVQEMTFENFYDIKALQEEWGTNFSVDEDRNQVKWHDIKVLRVEKEHPGSFYYKTSFSEGTFKKTFVRKRRAKDDNIVFKGLTQAYSEKIPLPEAKKKDIKELIKRNVIPKTYADSYFKTALGDI